MWYTVLHDEAVVGVADLPIAGIAAAIMEPRPAYEAIRATTRAATVGLLEAGLFGGVLPAVPPFPGEVLRLRRAMARAARLSLTLVAPTGAVADASFVNLLEAPEDGRVIVVAGFHSVRALVGARIQEPPSRSGDCA
jgi:hypothetical protein